jgi:sulfur carrier protein
MTMPSASSITVHTDHGPHTLPAGSSVADLLERLAAQAPHLAGCATAVNGDFVPRHQRAAHLLQHGDTLLCFAPITGG